MLLWVCLQLGNALAEERRSLPAAVHLEEVAAAGY